MSHKLLLRLFCLLLGFIAMIHTATAQLVGGSTLNRGGGTPTVIVDTTDIIQAHWDSTSTILVNGITSELYHVWLQQLRNGTWVTAGHYYTTDAEWVYQEPLPQDTSRLVVVPFNMIGGVIVEDHSKVEDSREFWLSNARRSNNIVVIDINRTANPATSTCQDDRIPFQTAVSDPTSLNVIGLGNGITQRLTAYSVPSSISLLPIQVRLRKECVIERTSDLQNYIIQQKISSTSSSGISQTELQSGVQKALAGAESICKYSKIDITNGQVILVEANE